MPEEQDMLPDQTPDSPAQPEAPAQEEPVSQDDNTASDEPGAEDSPEQSDSVPEGHVPYSRFKDEIKKRKELEKQLEHLQESSTTEEEPDEEIRQEIRELKMEKYLTLHPELNDKREELDEFIEENDSLSLERAVNLFRLEHGLIAAPTERKGLEKVTSGPKEAPKAKWTPDEVDKLRESNPKQWEKLIDSGELDDQGW